MNTRKYLLLTPLVGKAFGIKNKELIDSIHLSGCSVETTKDINGVTMLYVTAPKLEILELFCTDQEIDGLVVEYTAIFDQSVEED